MGRSIVERFASEKSPLYQEQEAKLDRSKDARNEVYGEWVVRSRENYISELQRSKQESALAESEMRRIDSLGLKSREVKQKKATLLATKQASEQSTERIERILSQRVPHQARDLLKGMFIKVRGYLDKYAKADTMPFRWEFFREGLERMISGPVASVELRRDGIRPPLSHEHMQTISEALSQNKLSSEACLEMITTHVESMKELQQEATALFAETKEQFTIEIERVVVEGLLPEQARANLGRLKKLDVQVADRFNDDLDSNVDASHARGYGAKIYPEHLKDKEHSRELLFHEFVHNIAGTAAHIMESGYSIAVQERKQGVSLPRQRGFERPFLWLDEAYTEWLALRLSQHSRDTASSFKGSDYYIEERKELEALFEHGLDPHLVGEAYFENITSEQSPKERAVHFARLVKRINEIMRDPAAFNKLEWKFFFSRVIRPVLGNNGIQSGDRFGSKENFIAQEKRPGAKFYSIDFSYGGNATHSHTTTYYTLAEENVIQEFETRGQEITEAIDGLLVRAIKGVPRKISWKITEIPT